MCLFLFAWLSISKTLPVFRQKDNLLLPRCTILLTRQTSHSEIFILLIMQTRHTSDSLFQTITNHPGSPPHLSHILFSTWNHTLAAFSVGSVEGKQTTRSLRTVLTHPSWQCSHRESAPAGERSLCSRGEAQTSSFGSKEGNQRRTQRQGCCS